MYNSQQAYGLLSQTNWPNKQLHTNYFHIRRIQGCPQEGGADGLKPKHQPPSKKLKNNTDFCRHYDIKSFTWFNPSVEISHWTRLMTVHNLKKNKLIILKRKQDHGALWRSHGTCSYICCFFTLDAWLLAISQYSEGPATGHLDTGFPWFPCV